MAVGCRTEWMKRDAQIGALDAVFYPALQMMIKGARPMGVTDCLNFASPEKPKIMSEFVASVEAITEASLALKIPVVSGNVSFYNETNGTPITSTPACGVVGLRPSVEKLPQDTFQKAGSKLVLVGIQGACAWPGETEWAGTLKASQVAFLGELFVQIAGLSGVKSSQMVGRGGLTTSLARMSTATLSARVDAKLSAEELSAEILYQAIFEVDFAEQILELGMNVPDVQIQVIGEVHKGDLAILGSSISLAELQSLPLEGARRIFETIG
jgi:phosphoribosylformylglycinamidine (FGAM) synthase-like enzyme